jgi:hypothetical protein
MDQFYVPPVEPGRVGCGAVGAAIAAEERGRDAVSNDVRTVMPERRRMKAASRERGASISPRLTSTHNPVTSAAAIPSASNDHRTSFRSNWTAGATSVA